MDAGLVFWTGLNWTQVHFLSTHKKEKNLKCKFSPAFPGTKHKSSVHRFQMLCCMTDNTRYIKPNHCTITYFKVANCKPIVQLATLQWVVLQCTSFQSSGHSIIIMIKNMTSCWYRDIFCIWQWTSWMLSLCRILVELLRAQRWKMVLHFGFVFLTWPYATKGAIII